MWLGRAHSLGPLARPHLLAAPRGLASSRHGGLSAVRLLHGHTGLQVEFRGAREGRHRFCHVLLDEAVAGLPRSGLGIGLCVLRAGREAGGRGRTAGRRAPARGTACHPPSSGQIREGSTRLAFAASPPAPAATVSHLYRGEWCSWSSLTCMVDDAGYADMAGDRDNHRWMSSHLTVITRPTGVEGAFRVPGEGGRERLSPCGPEVATPPAGQLSHQGRRDPREPTQVPGGLLRRLR